MRLAIIRSRQEMGAHFRKFYGTTSDEIEDDAEDWTANGEAL